VTVEYRRLESDDDYRAQAAALVHDGFAGFFGSEYWDWKYRSPFLANHDQVVCVAIVDDTVVGVYGATGGEYLIGPGNVVPSRITSDLIVHPDYQGKGISSGLIACVHRLSQHPEWSAAVSVLWTRAEINRILGANLGSIRVQSGTIAYTKTLDWDARLRELDATHVERAPAEPGRQLSVSFRIDDSPRFVLTREEEGMTWSAQGDAAIRVQGTRHSVDSALVGLSRRRLVEDLISRRLRISGRPSAVRKLIKHRADFGNALRPTTRA